MIQGTSSDCGKSFITTALCRIFSNMGYKVSPFKSQNMSNNSYVTEDGLEIGRAQGVQAEAARITPQVFMNPILLKPRKDTLSEIVLMGKVFDVPCDRNYYRNFTMNEGIKTVREALKEIENNFEIMVCEGAGSPAEINLNDGEIVNMRIAREADIPVLLVTDVDRGGSIASLVGTLELLGEDRKRVKGLIFNKFRGDMALFENAVKLTEEHTGIKVLGVMPWVKDIVIEGEDSLSFNWKKEFSKDSDDKINIGVVKFSRISNYTDIEAFYLEPDIAIIEIDEHTPFENLDAIILPGTMSSVLDMQSLLETGLAEKIRNFCSKGGYIFGICGGFQMMGDIICDPDFIDNKKIREIEGLKILPITTSFSDNKKITKKRKGKTIHPAFKTEIPVSGYEIHLGKSVSSKSSSSKIHYLFKFDDNLEGVANETLTVAGTYLHNVFHNDMFRNDWLNRIRESKGMKLLPCIDTESSKEESYNKLAELALENLDMNYLLKDIMGISAKDVK